MTRRAQQKQESHDRIVDSAAKRLATHGISGASVDAVMADAGLTHGGFYAHFDNKQAMVEEAFSLAQERLIEQLAKGLETGEGREAVLQMLARYLGRPHRDRPDEGCLIPVLMGEAVHQSAEIRGALEGEVQRLAAVFEDRLEGGEREDIALGLVALAVGGLSLSRAVADEEFSDRILRAARVIGHAALK